ncbi:M15 family metallopeptidase [Lutibacter sp. B2]|nr:M15 family metallopeptidase [Lutibacter sp. B2]
MKKLIISTMIISICLISGCVEKESLQNRVSKNPDAMIYDSTMKRDLLCLMMAYPEYIKNVERKTDGRVYVVMKSGKQILYDDKKVKSFQEKLGNPDLQDMMEQIYPISDIHQLMEKDFDPGRIRVYSLLKEVYGGSKEQIKLNLENVKIGYQNCSFNHNNKAADALQVVMKELVPMTQNMKTTYSFVFPTSGTFNYRLIAGTNRLSPHSFGTAIDLKRANSDYWKWTSREEGNKRLRSYPREIVQIFEKNNFVWGGKWGHFDILHFEYRPEILLKALYFSNKPEIGKLWNDGLTSEDTAIKNYSKLIDKALK